MSKKYVIVGAGGQLGKALCAMFPDAKALSREELDIANEKQVKVFNWSKYEVIINAAALVNADGSETDELRAKTWLVNAYGPRNLAKIAIEQNKRSGNSRSTVGTLTEIDDYIRLLFAKLGDTYCYHCGAKIEPKTIDQIMDTIKTDYQGQKIYLLKESGKFSEKSELLKFVKNNKQKVEKG